MLETAVQQTLVVTRQCLLNFTSLIPNVLVQYYVLISISTKQTYTQ